VTHYLHEALKNSLTMFGIEAMSPLSYQNSYHTIENHIVAIIGFTGEKKGTITLELDEKAFKKIIDTLMPKMNVEYEVKLSAISEIANILSGNFVSKAKLSGVDITPPTMITGKNIRAIIANTNTYYISCSIDEGIIIAGVSFQ